MLNNGQEIDTNEQNYGAVFILLYRQQVAASEYNLTAANPAV